MKITDNDPVFREIDKRYCLAFSRNKAERHYLNVYFINFSDEEIKSLNILISGYRYSIVIEGDDLLTTTEGQFNAIPPGGFVSITKLNISEDALDQYIFTLTIDAAKEKVIAEYIFEKKNMFSEKYDNIIPELSIKALKCFVESRSFHKKL